MIEFAINKIIDTVWTLVYVPVSDTHAIVLYHGQETRLGYRAARQHRDTVDHFRLSETPERKVLIARIYKSPVYISPRITPDTFDTAYSVTESRNVFDYKALVIPKEIRRESMEGDSMEDLPYSLINSLLVSIDYKCTTCKDTGLIPRYAIKDVELGGILVDLEPKSNVMKYDSVYTIQQRAEHLNIAEHIDCPDCEINN